MRLFLAAALCAAVVTLPIPAAAQHLSANLSGSNEAPTKVNTGAHGIAEFTVNETRSEISVDLRVFNLPTGTVGAHIHVGGPDTAGPIILDLQPVLSTTGDFTVNRTVTNGNLTVRTDKGIQTFEDAIQALLSGNTYINVHSSAFPGGEIRGQITRTP